MGILIVIVSFLGLLAAFVSSKVTEYKERARMCNVMAKSFEKCPECYIKGAAWLSDQWQTEMKNMGVDFNKWKKK